MTMYGKKLSLQVSERMLDDLRSEAAEEDMTLSEFIRWGLRKHLRERKVA